MSTLSVFREGFSPRYQDILNKTLIGMKFANTRLESELTQGKKCHRTIADFSDTYVRDVVRYADRAIGSLGDSDEYIEIDKQKAVDFKIDDWDKLQNGPRRIGELAGKQCAMKLRRYIDADILYQTINAADSFDDGDIAGTPGNGITLTTTNLAQVISEAQAKLLANNVDDNGDLGFAFDPYVGSIINQTLIGKNIALTDLTFKNGYTGPIVGFQGYVSNNLTFTGTLTISDQVSESDTVTINGVVFTFNATPSGAGSVDIGGDAQGSLDNLILAINGGAVGTTYIALSDADRLILTNSRVVAVKSGTTKILITATGAGRISCTEVLTHANNIWSKKMIHCPIGRMKQIDVVIQQDVKADLRPEPRQKTVNVLTDALYGMKVFSDGAANFFDLQIAVS